MESKTGAATLTRKSIFGQNSAFFPLIVISRGKIDREERKRDIARVIAAEMTAIFSPPAADTPTLLLSFRLINLELYAPHFFFSAEEDHKRRTSEQQRTD